MKMVKSKMAGIKAAVKKASLKSKLMDSLQKSGKKAFGYQELEAAWLKIEKAAKRAVPEGFTLMPHLGMGAWAKRSGGGYLLKASASEKRHLVRTPSLKGSAEARFHLVMG